MNKIEFGDCRTIMRQWANEGVKIQTCVTSPPYYGLRDYGHEGQLGLEETPEQYIANMVEVFQCVKDILADDGTLWVNIGDSYYNYRPGKGQALVQQTVANNDQDLPQTCARRGNKLEGLKEKDLIGIPWMLAFALRADGWYLRQDIIWHKPNPMPESVQDRCTKSHEYIFLLSKSPKYYYDIDSIKEELKEESIARNQSGWNGNEDRGYVSGKQNNMSKYLGSEKAKNETHRNRRSVWTVNTKPYSGAHFAVFPTELIEPCIMAGSRVGDIVLDPFMGSGTTAQVAQDLNRNFLGCELNSDYKPLQDKRLRQLSLELA
jgi:DNA modification methylase